MNSFTEQSKYTGERSSQKKYPAARFAGYFAFAAHRLLFLTLTTIYGTLYRWSIQKTRGRYCDIIVTFLSLSFPRNNYTRQLYSKEKTL